MTSCVETVSLCCRGIDCCWSGNVPATYFAFIVDNCPRVSQRSILMSSFNTSGVVLVTSKVRV